jgi:sirohydrochlorin ferrochelatase
VSAPALILFAHGSPVESANDSVRALAADMARKSGRLVEAAFLDGGVPDLFGAAARLRASGADRVVVVPYFLTMGLHLRRDLPALASELERREPNLRVEVVPPLEGHPALAGLLLDRAAHSSEEHL